MTNEYRYAYYKANKAAHDASSRKYRSSPKGQFLAQRKRAARRGIEWELTLDEWISFWGDDLPRRGRKGDQLCMCRTGDTGAYAVGNIYKDTNIGNRAVYFTSAACVANNRRTGRGLRRPGSRYSLEGRYDGK